jgi:hypothetical protein
MKEHGFKMMAVEDVSRAVANPNGIALQAPYRSVGRMGVSVIQRKGGGCLPGQG